MQAENSRGQITLQSADPGVQPRIDYNYLSTEADLRRMCEAIRTSVRILGSDAFRPLFRRLTELTGPTLDDDARLDEWMHRHLGTAIHLCGSAKLGPANDPANVVDQYGRVHGIQGLGWPTPRSCQQPRSSARPRQRSSSGSSSRVRRGD